MGLYPWRVNPGVCAFWVAMLTSLSAPAFLELGQ